MMHSVNWWFLMSTNWLFCETPSWWCVQVFGKIEHARVSSQKASHEVGNVICKSSLEDRQKRTHGHALLPWHLKCFCLVSIPAKEFPKLHLYSNPMQVSLNWFQCYSGFNCNPELSRKICMENFLKTLQHRWVVYWLKRVNHQFVPLRFDSKHLSQWPVRYVQMESCGWSHFDDNSKMLEKDWEKLDWKSPTSFSWSGRCAYCCMRHQEVWEIS